MNLSFSYLNTPLRVALLGLSLGLPACSGGGASKPAAAPPTTFEPFAREAPTVMGSRRSAASSERASPAAWSIAIVAAEGANAEGAAREWLQKVQTKGGLPEAYSERRGKVVVIAYGQYVGPDDPNAKRDLARIQSMEIDHARPFESAVLAPPPFQANAGSVPEYNLAAVKQSRGKDAIYTLQIGMYTRLDVNVVPQADLAVCRAKAEEWVVNLRREGEEAFYYHGPHGSMVTIGVYGPRDHDDTTPGRESFVLSEARRKHPLNLVNGAEFLVRPRGKPKATAQASFLVPIPN